MSTLDALGFAEGEGRTMLISPPDAVLAEASQLSPRPSIASTLQVGEPTQRIAWWLERRFLSPALLSRFYWMLQSAGGTGWLIFDPAEDEPLTVAELREALAPTELMPGVSIDLPNGDIALSVAPAA